MDSFTECQSIEIQGLADVLPFIRGNAMDGRFVLTDKGRLSEFLQREVGDILLNEQRNGELFSVELKSEQNNGHGNFFLETWSNRCPGGRMGWMYTLNADILLYYFLAEKTLYSMSFRRLWHWAFVSGGIYKYPERLQTKYNQKNQTCGRCVNIEHIGREVGFREYVLCDGVFILRRNTKETLAAS